MAKSRGSGRKHAKAVVDSMLRDPPSAAFEVRQRLSGISADSLRRELAERLEEALVTEREAEVIESIFGHLHAGKEHARLVQIAGDAAKPRHVRAVAMKIITQNPAVTAEEFARIAESPEMRDVIEDYMSSMVAAAAREPEVADVVAELFRQLEPAARIETAERIEEKRRAVGTSAAAAYRTTIETTDDPALRAFLIERAVEDGGIEAQLLLEDLRSTETDDELRRQYQRAYQRVRDADAEGRVRQEFVNGYALVSTCDGQGAFILIAAIDLPDGRRSLGDLCIRASADIRDGFLVTREAPEAIEEVLREVLRSPELEFARVTLGAAACLVEEAMSRVFTTQGVVSPELRPVVGFFQRIADDGTVLPAVPDDGPPVTVAELREVVKRPSFAGWFFDQGDLAGYGVLPPDGEKMPGARWYTAAIRKLDQPTVRARLAAMALHAARFFAWVGEPATAALFARAGRDVSSEFSSAALPRLMLERFFSPPDPGSASPMFPDLFERREDFKRILFQNTARPAGRELARLDFVHASEVLLGRLVNELPGELRLREPVMVELAIELGTLLADTLIRLNARGGSQTAWTRKVLEIVSRHTMLPPAVYQEFVTDFCAGISAFSEQVCGPCPVKCMKQPKASMAEWFSTPDHPSDPALMAWWLKQATD